MDRLRFLILGGLVAIPCAATIVADPPKLLVWNASASMPRGLYRIRPNAVLRRGDTVVAWLPRKVRGLAAERGYLPAGVPLVKRVAAMPGDQICARRSTVSVNGKASGIRVGSDPRRRLLPAWSGCFRLRPDEFLLLGQSSGSFDGRYFGPSKKRDIIGQVVLLWRA